MKRRLDKKKTVARAIARKTERYIATGMSPKNAGELARDEVKGFLNHRYVPRLKPRYRACPICGTSRRAGYFKACPGCLEGLDFYRSLKPLFEDLASELRRKSAAILRYEFRGTLGIELTVTLVAPLHVVNVSDGSSQDKRVRFHASKILSVLELQLLEVPSIKRVVCSDVLELFDQVREAVAAHSDDRGVSAELCGIPLPTGGGRWRVPT